MRYSISDLQLYNLVGQQAQAPAGVAIRRRAAGECNQTGFLFPVELAAVLSPWSTRIQRRIQPFQDETLARSFGRGDAHVQRLADGSVLPAIVGFQQDSSPSQFSR